MMITADQRKNLEVLIELAARGRALRHEHDNPKEAAALQQLVSEHKYIGAQKAVAAEVVEKFRTEVSDLSALIEKQTALIRKKSEELNDGTGLTSRDLVNLQSEIAGHEEKVAELEESELVAMEELETAEAALVEVEASLAEVTDKGRATQSSIKSRKAELSAELVEVEASADALKPDLPPALVKRFEHNVAAGGPGAAILGGPNCQACGQEISGMTWHSMLGNDVNETYECEECEAVLLRRG